MRYAIVLLAFSALHGQKLGVWPEATPASVGMDESLLARARGVALRGGGSGYVIRRGKLVYSWGDLRQKYDLKSTTKSIGVTALGLAIGDGKLRLSDKARKVYPDFGVPPESNAESNWLDEITLLHLATQTAGFDKPGGYEKLLFRPGTKWHYSDGGPNWLAEIVTLAYRRDVEQLMFERVFTPLGITPDDLHWRKNQYRPAEIDGIARREFGSGVHANVNAMARIGFLYLNNGHIGTRAIIPAEFVHTARAPVPASEGVPVNDGRGRASNHYGLLWWNNGDGTLAKVPRDAYWSWGLYDSLIVVIPSLDVVVARAGKSFSDNEQSSGYERLRPFLEPIAESVNSRLSGLKPPYPPSPVIESIEWAPASTILRAANGSDNFPTAWADDGNLYTAYGDGWGFEPKLPEKLGLGFAKLIGGPENFQGINIRSEAENRGQGQAGKKASGMLMVDGVLYMWVRNASNSQLAWSSDHAKSWSWSDWKFTASFGHPAFLSFGRNYSGARDNYVYIYSPDADSAYVGAPRIVLARVPQARLREKVAYEFFENLDSRGAPVWTREITRRGGVFEFPPNHCYRTQVSYNPGLKRYIMNQILYSEDTLAIRFAGGFGIYDAPEPWGPWTTAYFTERWDTGPGENQHFPPKWMSADGKTMYLVSSGEDMFSLRKAVLRLRQ